LKFKYLRPVLQSIIKNKNSTECHSHNIQSRQQYMQTISRVLVKQQFNYNYRLDTSKI